MILIADVAEKVSNGRNNQFCNQRRVSDAAKLKNGRHPLSLPLWKGSSGQRPNDPINPAPNYITGEASPPMSTIGPSVSPAVSAAFRAAFEAFASFRASFMSASSREK